MILFDPAHFAVNASAQPYYDILHEAGILYYSPELCSKKINRLQFGNSKALGISPHSWWRFSDSHLFITYKGCNFSSRHL